MNMKGRHVFWLTMWWAANIIIVMWIITKTNIKELEDPIIGFIIVACLFVFINGAIHGVTIPNNIPNNDLIVKLSPAVILVVIIGAVFIGIGLGIKWTYNNFNSLMDKIFGV